MSTNHTYGPVAAGSKASPGGSHQASSVKKRSTKRWRRSLAATAALAIAGTVAVPHASAHDGHDDPHIYEEGWCDFAPSSYKKLLSSALSPGTELSIAGLGVPPLADVAVRVNGVERAIDTDGNSWFRFEFQDHWVGANRGYLTHNGTWLSLDLAISPKSGASSFANAYTCPLGEVYVTASPGLFDKIQPQLAEETAPAEEETSPEEPPTVGWPSFGSLDFTRDPADWGHDFRDIEFEAKPSMPSRFDPYDRPSGPLLSEMPDGHLVLYEFAPHLDALAPEITQLRHDTEILAVRIHPDLAELVAHMPDELLLNFLGEFLVIGQRLMNGDLEPIDQAAQQSAGGGTTGSAPSGGLECPSGDSEIQAAIAQVSQADVGGAETERGWESNSDLAAVVSDAGVPMLFAIGGDGQVMAVEHTQVGANGGTFSAEYLQSGNQGDAAGEGLTWVIAGEVAEKIFGSGPSKLFGTGFWVELHLQANMKLVEGADAASIEAMGVGQDKEGEIYKGYAEAADKVTQAKADYEQKKGESDRANQLARDAAAKAEKDPTKENKDQAARLQKEADEKAKETEAAAQKVVEAEKEKQEVEEKAKEHGEANGAKDQLEPEFNLETLFLHDPFMAAMRRVLAQQGLFLTETDAENMLRERGADLTPYIYPAPDIETPPLVSHAQVQERLESRLPVTPPPENPGAGWAEGSICGISLSGELSTEDLEGDPCIQAVCLDDPDISGPVGPREPDIPEPVPGGGGPLPVRPTADRLWNRPFSLGPWGIRSF